METERLHIVRVEIEYDRYDNVVLYYNLEKVGPEMNAYNLFRQNEPLGRAVMSTNIRLLDESEWNDYKTTGKVKGETVWEGFPD